jgi:phage shock protein A
MGRKQQDVAEAIDLPALDGAALTADQNLMTTMLASHSEERDLLNQLLGQAQMSDAFAKFSVTVTTSKLAYVKENKLYRALKGQKSRNGYDFLNGSWEEFCNLLGISVEKADKDIANLRAFGEEALESMSRMGIGYREMRQYRRLPEDQKSALIEVAKTGDKDAFIDLAEEIIAKHAKEKEELTQRLDETNADYEAQSEVMAKKTKELDTTKQELEKTRKRIQSMPANEAAKELRQEVAAVAYEAEASILGSLRAGFTKLEEHATESGEDHRSFKAALIRQLEITLASVRSEFHLPEQLDGDPVWLNAAEA